MRVSWVSAHVTLNSPRKSKSSSPFLQLFGTPRAELSLLTLFVSRDAAPPAHSSRRIKKSVTRWMFCSSFCFYHPPPLRVFFHLYCRLILGLMVIIASLSVMWLKIILKGFRCVYFIAFKREKLFWGGGCYYEALFL